MSDPSLEEVAVLHTNLGDIVLGFYANEAPRHVANFKKLVRQGFYDGTKFHQVVPDWWIRGGDPNSRLADCSLHGHGGPGYTLTPEINDLTRDRGALVAVEC